MKRQQVKSAIRSKHTSSRTRHCSGLSLAILFPLTMTIPLIMAIPLTMAIPVTMAISVNIIKSR